MDFLNENQSESSLALRTFVLHYKVSFSLPWSPVPQITDYFLSPITLSIVPSDSEI